MTLPRANPPSAPAVVTPLAPERYKLQLTLSRETHDKLRHVQDLLRHALPGGVHLFEPEQFVTLRHCVAVVPNHSFAAASSFARRYGS